MSTRLMLASSCSLPPQHVAYKSRVGMPGSWLVPWHCFCLAVLQLGKSIAEVGLACAVAQRHLRTVCSNCVCPISRHLKSSPDEDI